MPNPRVQTRIPEDDYERFEEYRSERDISQSEATRRLVRAGLEAEEADGDLGGEADGMAVAGINQFARDWGGVLIGLVILAVLLFEIGGL
jgi:hypothetical protein